MVFTYIIKFFSVTVVGCLQPTNWEACLPVHRWLLPEIQNGIEILLNPDIPYKTERDYLQKVVNSNVINHVPPNE